MASKILTANLLIGGGVVFLGNNARWYQDIRCAKVCGEADEVETLQQMGAAAVANNVVVEPYLVDVTHDANGTITPVKTREALRSRGPTVRPDLGYQSKELVAAA